MLFDREWRAVRRAHKAGERRDWDTVRSLLLAVPELAQHSTYKGDTLLHLAAIFGRAEEVAMMLNAGANPNATDSYGHTALKRMAFEGHNGDEGYAATARVLIEHGADVNKCGEKGPTPLAEALSWGRLLDDDNQPVQGAANIMSEFIAVLREHGGHE